MCPKGQVNTTVKSLLIKKISKLKYCWIQCKHNTFNFLNKCPKNGFQLFQSMVSNLALECGF